MSSSSRNRAIVRYNTGEEEDNAPNTSDRRTGTASKRGKNQTNDNSNQSLDSEDIDRIVADCVKYLLIVDHKKTPIKRVDMFKAVLKQNPNRKTTEELMQKISLQLSKTFAIELCECPENPNSYILVNSLAANGLKEAIDSHSIPDNQWLQTGLLSPVLAVIFMSGGSVHEDVIWKFISKLGFDPNSKTKTIPIETDSTGITVKKLVTELWVRQLYLKYEKIARNDSNVHEFKWGFRADKEFSKMDVLKFVCEVYADGSDPKSWRPQYTAAQQEEEQTDTGNDADIEVIP